MVQLMGVLFLFYLLGYQDHPMVDPATLEKSNKQPTIGVWKVLEW
jgi:hypothetical protein